jgi:hypothetical protein
METLSWREFSPIKIRVQDLASWGGSDVVGTVWRLQIERTPFRGNAKSENRHVHGRNSQRQRRLAPASC